MAYVASEPSSVPDAETLLAETIADQLGETDPEPRRILRRMTRYLGSTAMKALLEAVWTIEAQGGILLPDGRRRTPGGVLFYLTKIGATLQPPPPSWWIKGSVPGKDESSDTVDGILMGLPQTMEQGVATVTMQLSGRPKQPEQRNGFVVLSMVSRAPQSLPKGLPVPPPEETTWTVLVSDKQWNAVAKTLQANKEDKLIIKGQPCQVGVKLLLYATEVLSLVQQREKHLLERVTTGAEK